MLAITILNQSQHEQVVFQSGPLSLGSDPEGRFHLGLATSNHLIVDDPQVAAQQLEIRWNELSTDPAILLTNVGRSLALSSGPRIHRGRTVELELPVSFCVGDTQIQIFDAAATHDLDFGLTRFSIGEATDQADPANQISPGPDTLAAWLEALSDLQRAVAGSHELFRLAAKAIFNPGGLDGAMVLLPTADGWQIAASHIPYPDHGIGFREDLVRQAASSMQTIYHDANVTDQATKISDLHSAVVCPVPGEGGKVVAAAYGFRSLHRRNSRRGIRPLEAQFVQVVADALSAGMIRMESEAKAAHNKVLLEQAFSPGIARQLQSNPRFLDARTREVSVLFADLRGFSSISERIGTRETYQLLADVLDRFSDVITDLDGVIVDFFGDGVSAFWNAPFDQPAHAMLACQAGMEMLKCIPELNEIWASRIGEELRVGIGIHTGPARVGNSGSRRRLKYGPRGSTVNIASRLESATKQIGIPLVVSGATASQVDSSYFAQRIVKSALAGIKSPMDIYRLIAQNEVQSGAEFECYESALKQFESGNLIQSQLILTEMIQRAHDPATEFLLKVVSEQIQYPASLFSGQHDLSASSRNPLEI